MAVISRSDGQVIAWSGELDGPHTVYGNTGVPRTMSEYFAQLGVGEADKRQIVLYVTDSVKMVLGLSAFPQREELIKRCLARCIEDRLAKGRVPENNEHFAIGQLEMEQLRDKVLNAV